MSQKNQQINGSFSEISVATNAIVKDIAQVNRSFDGVTEDSIEIRQFGKDMSELSKKLQQMIAKFNLS